MGYASDEKIVRSYSRGIAPQEAATAAEIPHRQVALVAPQRPRAGHHRQVVAAAGVVAEVAIIVPHAAAIGDDQLVAREDIADQQATRVGPNGAGAGHDSRVVTAASTAAENTAQNAKGARHLGTIAYDQLIARAVQADVDGDVPDRPRAGDECGIGTGHRAGSK